METSKLKNIVLFILLFTNLLLLLLVVSQRLENRQLQRQTLVDAVSLLQERGIAVSQEILEEGEFPPALQVERDSAWEAQMFTDLLGDGTTLAQRGLVTFYTGPRGEAQARSDGGFSIVFAPDAYPLQDQSMTQHALDVLQTMGFTAQITAAEEGVLTATQRWNDSPVFSCTAVLTYDSGYLAAIQGTRLLGKPSEAADDHTPLSLAALLVKFRGGIIESGDACTALLAATRGYALSADGVSLTPVLCLETDTGRYYLSALTGEFFQT